MVFNVIATIAYFIRVRDVTVILDESYPTLVWMLVCSGPGPPRNLKRTLYGVEQIDLSRCIGFKR